MQSGHDTVETIRQFAGMHRNLALTRAMENSRDLRSSANEAAISLDRRVSVAPMMDYTDDRNFS